MHVYKLFLCYTRSSIYAEVMKKRFSKDLLGKERHVWIEPRTKSIHWYVLLLFCAHLLLASVHTGFISHHLFMYFLCRAKNAHDRHANVKVKYFLLDKNNPSLYIGTDRPMFSSSTATTATAASAPINRAEVNSNSNSSAAENIDTTDTTSSNTIEGVPAAALLTGASVLNGGESNTNKAQGQLVGIIHSATINHLSIRIQTESGDYLNLTVSDLVELYCMCSYWFGTSCVHCRPSFYLELIICDFFIYKQIHSGKGATQRAKDWFEVIKTLTRDISTV